MGRANFLASRDVLFRVPLIEFPSPWFTFEVLSL
jgi:hypothetical protein